MGKPPIRTPPPGSNTWPVTGYSTDRPAPDIGTHLINTKKEHPAIIVAVVVGVVVLALLAALFMGVGEMVAERGEDSLPAAIQVDDIPADIVYIHEHQLKMKPLGCNKYIYKDSCGIVCVRVKRGPPSTRLWSCMPAYEDVGGE